MKNRALYAATVVLLAPFAAFGSDIGVDVDADCFAACYDESVERCREEGELTEEECDEEAVALCESECSVDDDVGDLSSWDDGLTAIRPPEGFSASCKGCSASGDPGITLGALLFAALLFALRARR